MWSFFSFSILRRSEGAHEEGDKVALAVPQNVAVAISSYLPQTPRILGQLRTVSKQYYEALRERMHELILAPRAFTLAISSCLAENPRTFGQFRVVNKLWCKALREPMQDLLLARVYGAPRPERRAEALRAVARIQTSSSSLVFDDARAIATIAGRYADEEETSNVICVTTSVMLRIGGFEKVPTVVHELVRKGKWKKLVLQILEEQGPEFSATPAYLASKSGNADAVRALFELGADLNAATLDGATPAYVASANGHAEVSASARPKN